MFGGASLANPLLGECVLGWGEGIVPLSLVLFSFLLNEMIYSSPA